MKMLSMLWKNFWGGHRTLQFPARPTVTEHFRGLVEFDPALCSGCADLQVPLHLARHRFQGRQRRVHVELRSRAVHVLRALRGGLQGTCAQPARRYAAGVHGDWAS